MRLFRRNLLPSSKLYDQDTFWQSFVKDISRAQEQLIIESPFITSKRSHMLLPIFDKLCRRGVQITINTRNPIDHEGIYREQAIDAIESFQELGITVLYTAGHHRKLAIVDTEVVWEGSLNILSFSDSCEIMRRVVSSVETARLLKFIGLEKHARR